MSVLLMWGIQVAVLDQDPRKFLVIGGVGAGIGNFLIFFPSAYYFAAFTGRDILIHEDSLIGEEVLSLARKSYYYEMT